MANLHYLGVLDKVNGEVWQLCSAYCFPSSAVTAEERDLYRARYQGQALWAAGKTDVGTTASFERDIYKCHCTVDSNGIACVLVCNGTKEDSYPQQVAVRVLKSVLKDYRCRHLNADGSRKPRVRCENKVMFPIIECLLNQYQDPERTADAFGMECGLRALSGAEKMIIRSERRRADDRLQHWSDESEGDGDAGERDPNNLSAAAAAATTAGSGVPRRAVQRESSWVVVEEDLSDEDPNSHRLDRERDGAPAEPPRQDDQGRDQRQAEEPTQTQTQAQNRPANPWAQRFGQVYGWARLAWQMVGTQVDNWSPYDRRRPQ